MRVNIYAEEMPAEPRLEIIEKEIEGNTFTALRIYLELPATIEGKQYQGPFIHRPGDDDSAAVTFWGKRDLRITLRKALALLDAHYYEASKRRPADPVIPRRIDLRRWCPAEMAISVAMDAIEAMPADIRLTGAVRLLGEARGLVADFVDGADDAMLAERAKGSAA